MPPIENETPEPSLRDTLEQSIESSEAGDGGAGAPAGGQPAAGAAPASPYAPPAGTDTAQGAPDAAKGTPSGRDPNGRFQKPGVAPTQQQTQAPTDGVAPAVKAPGTWTPQAREHWQGLPEEVRNEVVRREREVSRAMTTSHQARQFQNEFQQAVQPFMGFITAEGSNPIAATVSMMQTAATLRTGTVSQKAELVAEVIKQYGIDVETLDSLLAGQGAPQQRQATDYIDQLIQQRLTPYQQRLQQFDRMEQEAAQALDAEIEDDLSAFAADPKHEFFEDVKAEMADLIEVAQRQGRTLSLTDAYERATLLSEPVRQTLQRRSAGQSAQQGHRIAQRARSGAISVQSSAEAGVTTPARGDSIRDTLTAAFEANSGR